MSMEFERAIKVGENSRLFERIDDPSYSELEEHVGEGVSRAYDLDGFERDEYYMDGDEQGAERRALKEMNKLKRCLGKVIHGSEAS